MYVASSRMFKIQDPADLEVMVSLANLYLPSKHLYMD